MSETVESVLDLVEEINAHESAGERVAHLRGIASGTGGFGVAVHHGGLRSGGPGSMTSEDKFEVKLTDIDRIVLLRALELFEDERVKKVATLKHKLKGMLK